MLYLLRCNIGVNQIQQKFYYTMDEETVSLQLDAIIQPITLYNMQKGSFNALESDYFLIYIYIYITCWW